MAHSHGVASHLLGASMPAAWPIPPGQPTASLPQQVPGHLMTQSLMTTRPSDRRRPGSTATSLPARYGSGAGSLPPAAARAHPRYRSRDRERERRFGSGPHTPEVSARPPAGPQEAMEWTSAFEEMRVAIETLQRNQRNQHRPMQLALLQLGPDWPTSRLPLKIIKPNS